MRDEPTHSERIGVASRHCRGSIRNGERLSTISDVAVAFRGASAGVEVVRGSIRSGAAVHVRNFLVLASENRHRQRDMVEALPAGSGGAGRDCWFLFSVGWDVRVLGATRRFGEMGEADLVCGAAIWFVVLLFGFCGGSAPYYFCVYLPQVLRGRREPEERDEAVIVAERKTSASVKRIFIGGWGFTVVLFCVAAFWPGPRWISGATVFMVLMLITMGVTAVYRVWSLYSWGMRNARGK